MAAKAAINSKYVEELEVDGTGVDSATITMKMRATGNTADVDGKTVVYTVKCVAGATCTSSTSGTVAAKFLPKSGS